MLRIIIPLLAFWLILAPAAPAPAQPAAQMARSLKFCNETVPLTQREVYQAVDQNLILLAEAKSRIWLTLRRSARYLPIIEAELKRAGVPDDLKYIPMTITSLAPDYNSVGRGLWRLREAEAKTLGLKVDKDMDERLDPVASTVAAAKRLKELKNTYGTWTMAMAAHLLSEAVIQRAVSEAGGERDYFKIYLPDGLDQLPASVLAGKIIFLDPGLFGYHQQSSRSWLVASARRETLKEAASVRDLAKKYGQDYKTFRDMNPHLLTGTAPAGATINTP
jgi:hypothetical protein